MKKADNSLEYLAALPAEQRVPRAELRDQIIASAPGVEEHFEYGLPGFKLNGHALLYFGATKMHCALYGMIPPEFAERLEGYKTSKGAIQFTPEKPISAALVKAIVNRKVKENELKRGGKGRIFL